MEGREEQVYDYIQVQSELRIGFRDHLSNEEIILSLLAYLRNSLPNAEKSYEYPN